MADELATPSTAGDALPGLHAPFGQDPESDSHVDCSQSIVAPEFHVRVFELFWTVPDADAQPDRDLTRGEVSIEHSEHLGFPYRQRVLVRLVGWDW